MSKFKNGVNRGVDENYAHDLSGLRGGVDNLETNVFWFGFSLFLRGKLLK